MKYLFNKFKIATAALLSFMLMTSGAYAVFPDIDAEATMYYDAIVYLEGKDTVVGFSDGTFRPEANISRAEFTKIIVETQFTDAQIEACNEMVFPDVEEDNPHYNHICVAHQNNVVHGYSDGEFKPDVDIMADQAAKVVVNSYGIGFGQTADTSLGLYVDQLEMRDAWPNTVENEKDMLKRNEMAQIVYRLEVNTAFEVIVESQQFSNMEAAVIQAELEAILTGEAEYTVFAPNDNAFNGVDETQLENLLTDDTRKDELREILLEHTVEGTYTFDMLLEMDNETIQSVEGTNLLVDVDGSTVHVQDQFGTRAEIVDEGMMTSNGMVFEIDTVLNWTL